MVMEHDLRNLKISSHHNAKARGVKATGFLRPTDEIVKRENCQSREASAETKAETLDTTRPSKELDELLKTGATTVACGPRVQHGFQTDCYQSDLGRHDSVSTTIGHRATGSGNPAVPS